jgi:LemA protein
MVAVLVMLAVLAVLVIVFIAIYNSLIVLRNQVKNSWSQIDVQLKRRHDLIPNLVETVTGYMKHERETLEKITQARAQAMQASGVRDVAKAEGALSDAMSKFYVVAENYPDLKANQNFLGLQEELRSTENKISFARQAYNDQVLFYNNKIQVVPSNIVASLFGFAQEEYFQIEDKAEKEVPKVKF